MEVEVSVHVLKLSICFIKLQNLTLLFRTTGSFCFLLCCTNRSVTLDVIYLQPTHDPVCCICASDKLLILVSVVNFILPVFPCLFIMLVFNQDCRSSLNIRSVRS